ncbi:MAG: PAS domain S-box protein [Anaerolineae bacterium]|nr:PAS domain S-box protein [Anaerolineae bacterium]
MQRLAAKIRAELPTLTVEYAHGLAKLPGYAELPAEEHLAASQYDFELLATCLEAGAPTEFHQYIQERLAERLEEGFAVEVLVEGLTVLEQILSPLVEELAAAKFLWATFSRAQRIVMQSVAQQLQSSESQYQRLVSRSPVGLFRTTPDGQVEEGNPAFLEITGYDSLAAINAVGVASLYVDPAEREQLLALLQEGTVTDFETSIRRPDGRIIAIAITARLVNDEKSGSQCLEGIIQDITARRELEQERRQLARAVEAIYDAVVITDAQGAIQFVNAAFEKLTGYKQAEVLGKNPRMLKSGEQSDELYDGMWQSIISGQPWQGEMTNQRKDGTYYEAFLTISPICDAAGQTEQFVAVQRDVSARKALEEQIQVTLKRRAHQMQLSTEVSQEIAALTNLTVLLQRVVTLVKERFGYYHAQIFRHALARDAMVLVAGYGTAGEEMVAAGNSLPYGRGVVGAAAATGEPVLAADVTQEDSWVPHPNLPETKGELAVPIKWRTEVLGVLDVQSDTAGALSQDDQILLVGLCGQIAVAIQNTRLRREMEENLQELERLTSDMGREGWEALRQESPVRGYLFDHTDLSPASELWNEEIRRVAEQGELTRAVSEEQPAVVAPLAVRGELLGALGVYEDPTAPLTVDELDLIDSVSREVAQALEGARLFEESQRARIATDRLYNLSRDLTVAADAEGVLQVLRRPARESGAVEVKLFYIDLNEAGEPTWLELVAVWRREGEPALPVGSRRRLSATPFAKLWLGKPDEVFFIADLEHDARLDELSREPLRQLGFRAQAILPLKQAEQWLGFLAFSWLEPHELSAEEQELYRSLITLCVPAVANLRLLAQTEEALAEVEVTHRLYVREQWTEFFSLQGLPSYERTQQGTTSARAGEFPPAVERAMRERATIVQLGEDDEPRSSLVAPIILHDEVIGALGLENEGREWSADERVLIRAVSVQLGLALENARLLEDSQRRAARERLIGEISSRLRASSDVETVLQRTVQELGQTLGATGTIVMRGETDDQQE